MIARVWRAKATPTNYEQYAEHFRTDIAPSLARLDGYRGGYLMHLTERGLTRIIVMTLWESRQSVVAFAGENIDVAVIAPRALPLLNEYDLTVTHFDVETLTPLPQGTA